MIEKIMNELEKVQKDLSKIIEGNKFEEDMSDLLNLGSNILESKEFDNKIRNFKKYYRDNVYMNQNSKFYKDDQRYDALEKLCELLKSQNAYMSKLEKAIDDTEKANIDNEAKNLAEEKPQEKEESKEDKDEEKVNFNGLLGEIINNKPKKVASKKEEKIEIKIDIEDKKKLDVLNEAIDKWENKMRSLFVRQIENYQNEIKEFNKKYKNVLFPSAEILHEKISILNRYSPEIYEMTIDKLEKCITKHTLEVREKVTKEIKTIDVRQVIEQEFENYHLELR